MDREVKRGPMIITKLLSWWSSKCCCHTGANGVTQEEWNIMQSGVIWMAGVEWTGGEHKTWNQQAGGVKNVTVRAVLSTEDNIQSQWMSYNLLITPEVHGHLGCGRGVFWSLSFVQHIYCIPSVFPILMCFCPFTHHWFSWKQYEQVFLSFFGLNPSKKRFSCL